MIPANMHDFILGCLTAATSFIGLLFVAISILLQNQTKDVALSDRERVLSEAAYSGLINIFFVSILALVPGDNVGYVCGVMAILSLFLTWHLRVYGINWRLVLSFVVYVLELVFALTTIAHDSRLVNESYFVEIIIFIFAASLTRAWELTGIRKRR